MTWLWRLWSWALSLRFGKAAPSDSHHLRGLRGRLGGWEAYVAAVENQFSLSEIRRNLKPEPQGRSAIQPLAISKQDPTRGGGRSVAGEPRRRFIWLELYFCKGLLDAALTWREAAHLRNRLKNEEGKDRIAIRDGENVFLWNSIYEWKAAPWAHSEERESLLKFNWKVHKARGPQSKMFV